MKKRWFCVLLALWLLLCLVACAFPSETKRETAHPFIECPLPGIEWGMTKAEVLEKLTFPEDYPYPGDIESLKNKFGNEDTNVGAVKPSFVGWENPTVAGMGVAYYAGDVTDYRGANLVFCPPVNGEQYLVSVIISLRAENEETYRKALTEAYGKPVDPWDMGEKMIWTSDSEGTVLDEAMLTAYEEAGVLLLPYYEEELQTWHIKPVVYPWWFSLDEEDIVDGMQNFITEFDARQYVMVKLYEDGVFAKEETAADDVYAAPVPGFHWGITWDYAAGLLSEAGVDSEAAELQTSDTNTRTMRLTAEDAEKLGFNSALGLPLANEDKTKAGCIDLRFLKDKDGTARLVSAVLMVEKPNDEELKAAMDAATIGVLHEGRSLFETVWITMTEEDVVGIDRNQFNSEQLAEFEQMLERGEGALCFPYLYLQPSAAADCVLIYISADFYVFHCYGNF